MEILTKEASQKAVGKYNNHAIHRAVLEIEVGQSIVVKEGDMDSNRPFPKCVGDIVHCRLIRLRREGKRTPKLRIKYNKNDNSVYITRIAETLKEMLDD
jgi:hypothetical protein